ncbi:molybdopterin oxidoreductase [Thermoplasmatales archaeon SG8-52-1]|nr:MAG: molybdopterin oxidoreductase [Thermoplasmatales archaeon SG8-52-1]
MTNEKDITCIVCPIGCKILIKTNGKQCEILKGSKCKKGTDYARNEALDPRRMLTSSILVNNGEWPLVSVKSSKPVPKGKVFSVLKEIKKTKVNAPVKSGQIIIKQKLHSLI